MEKKRMLERGIAGLLVVALVLSMVPMVAVPAVVAQDSVRISEIRIDQTSDDLDEYFELTAAGGASLDGLTYLVLGDGTTASGVIEAVVNLSGYEVPASGYFVAAEATFSLGTADLTTDLNFENSDNVTHLLVSGFTGANGDDLDTNDDGTLDVKPWEDIVDLIALIEEENPPLYTEYHYGPPTVGPDGSYVPGHAFWCTDGWQIGLFDIGGGDDTPGAANACGAPPPPPIYINEFSASTTGTDVEYIEIYGDPNTDYSAYTILEIEGDDAGAGVVDEVISVGTTDASGFYLANLPANALENGTVSLLLVKDFTGALGNDLDTDNDGVLDVTPWSEVADAVAVWDGGATDQTYGTTELGPNYDGVSSFAPGGASRIPDGYDTDAATDWVRNDFDLAGIPGFTGTPDLGEALNTPGATNQLVTPPPPPAVYINEFSASTTGTDVEYVEIYGDPNTDYSAYTLLEIEGDYTTTPPGRGAVDEVIAIGTTDPSGFWLGSLPANALENGTISLLLVKDFTGALGDDLDADDDGVIDATPWGELVDAVAVNDGGSGDLTYGVPALGVSYDGLPYAPGGASRIPDGFDTDAASDWVRNDFDLAGIDGYAGSITLGEAYNTPGAPNEAYVPPPELCGDPYTPIYEVQGDGLTSPLVGTEVAVEGVVVGDFQNNTSDDNGNLGGFHIQDPTGDGNPLTSDGVFAYGSAIDVSVGDHVRVRGTVSEYYGLTEINITQVWICSSGNELPAPAELSLPVVESLDEFEPYEGMLVTFPQALVISEYYNFDRYGEIVLTSERQDTPTAVVEPGDDAVALAEANALDRITLDDGRTSQNPDPAIHPNGSVFDLTNLFRGGDTVTNVTGVMDYSYSLYRIQPTQGADYSNANPRTDAPDNVGDPNVKVASFNVLNYFTTIDTGALICGPSEDMECRGADTTLEYERQRDKIVAALAAMDADVVGLIEIENNVTDYPTEDLVYWLNEALGATTYSYIATGAIGTDAIRQAFIYKPAKVTPVGLFAVLDTTVDPRFLDDYNRPALAQTFMDNTGGAIFTVAVNHLKSKGSDCNAIEDPDTGDGSGNCNLTRKAAAEALVDWLASDPTGSGDGDFLIIGDLNSYDKEDPIDVLVDGGYNDLIYKYLGETAYSYVFDSAVGYLDHALANADMSEQITGATIWHINADEPDLIDYDMSFKQDAQDAIYWPDAYRASDHDPVIVGFCEPVPPEVTITLNRDTLWPPRHQYVTVHAKVDVTDNLDPDPVVELVSVTSSQPDDGLGDGDTPDDIVILNDYTFKLRAERMGGDEDRIYTIIYAVTDDCGNVTIATATVTVPHDMGSR